MTAITLLDGGMGQELIHRAGDKPTPLWSTQVMVDHPGMVAAVHFDYRDAGATVHTTNTYAIHRDRLAGTPFEDQFAALHQAALTEAQGVGRIAGSIGPLGASYRPDIHPEPNVAAPLYAEVATLLAPGVDLMICETVASLTHAKAVLTGAQAADKPIWIALTVDDEDGTKLRSGEALADAIPLANAGAAAILVNCSAPEAIPAAMDVLSGGDLPFGAYANAFTQITKEFLQDKPTVEALTARRDLDPDAYAQAALGWIRQGATIVGGCCEVGPVHIATLAAAIRAAGHAIE
ncbi:MAG: homocysteine S-methyltransferase family protein [Pseudomonadota bacterium]